ncbi:hypothetical protein A3C26_04245 [Candidatus Daviesbacteria bacterium RIFCSPHIGHO2_02_FULL_39_12]|uniref:t-SNARE coiled-coil homology domain-containing protein n=2 Tax=Candidatus Daviesiibacteriota TaxID=1752718 RepID=A0A1F5JDA5_9BACT|nr:MAG: hypothetical protein A3C26_04245 [Candidatus Daviesbacteria bacterium RIFCSPHIGHO2_02_FULL_39_12]OGE71577.1 MAG: hypothetical protein A3H40_03865 [Candidatus Daviesbacteria bacterium RIFCSPLOWO2_02_FULL_38_15]
MVNMNDTQKMLRAIINGQSSFRQEVSSKIDKLDKKLEGRIDGLESRIDQVDKNLTERMDKIGKQLAYLEDDTPTREEYDHLEERVDKIEQKVTPIL